MPENITAPLIPILKMIMSDVLMPLFMFSVCFSFALVMALVIANYRHDMAWYIRNTYSNVIQAILRRESIARDKLITLFIYGDHRALYAVAVFMAIVLVWFVINL